MDDIDLNHKVLGQQLKIWSDRYACVLETKGGAVPNGFDNFVVTSQYTIDEIFEDDRTREALHRRFKCIHMIDPFKVPEAPAQLEERASNSDDEVAEGVLNGVSNGAL